MARSIGSILRRSAEVLGTEGARSLFFKVLGETCYRRLTLVQRRIGAPAPIAETSRGAGARRLTIDDESAFTAYRPEMPRSTVRDRLAAGDECFIVCDGERIVHSCWVASGVARIDYLALDVALEEDAVYVYEVHTDREYRGRSISSIRSLEMERRLGERGVRRLVAAIWPENRPAMSTMAKAGYEVVGRVGYVGFGSLRREFCRTEHGEPAVRLARAASAR